MAMNRDNQSNNVRRRVCSDGVIEECSAAMGRVFNIPADPQPRKLDVRYGAVGWERLQTFLRRLRR